MLFLLLVVVKYCDRQLFVSYEYMNKIDRRELVELDDLNKFINKMFTFDEDKRKLLTVIVMI